MVRKKDEVRRRLLRLLKQQKEDDRRRKSEAIRKRVFRLAAFRWAQTVCCYVALPYEVQTWRMIEAMLQQGKRVVVPMIQTAKSRAKRGSRTLRLSEVRDPRTELAPGTYGVWEPVPRAIRPVSPRDVDLIFVPAVAFDRRGHRLGHGQGYFDRLLARLPKATPKIGLAYRCQLLDHLPTAAHDHPVDAVLSA